jgi:NAD(P)-dependent dehydrogenase (short-subunit alcohol dehydrogenase family)
MRLLLTLSFTLLGAVASNQAQSAESPTPKAVLVTGASSGIGRKVTEKLAADGYFVYAGARKEEDLKALGAIKNVQAVRLDVTKIEDIDAAVETIKRGGRGLYGLVNNAGVSTIGTLTDLKPEEFDLVMAVNVYGPYRVTRAFEPLVIAEKGRIVTMGSIAGIGAPADLGAYAMSKHAMEAFTDSLAEQMRGLGVRVSIIEPGNFNSQIGNNATLRTGVVTRLANRSRYKDPDEVADAVENALFDPKPKRRYMVAPDQGDADWTIRKQIEQLVQLNEGQPYTYDRDALIKMLDEALANARPRTR